MFIGPQCWVCKHTYPADCMSGFYLFAFAYVVQYFHQATCLQASISNMHKFIGFVQEYKVLFKHATWVTYKLRTNNLDL